MTRDDIIRMAIKCQLVTTSNRDGVYADALDRFAALVAAEKDKEIERLREALRVCLAHWFKDDNPDELQENVAKFKELCGWENKL